MMGSFAVYFSPDAGEDLRKIGDAGVVAELIHLAMDELRVPPVETPIEGIVPKESEMWWRRAVLISDLDSLEEYEVDTFDEYSHQACDHVFVYRYATQDEVIRYRLDSKTFMVVRVLPNQEIKQFSHQNNNQ